MINYNCLWYRNSDKVDTGNITEEGENATPIVASNNYANLPGVHMKYNFTNNSNLRLAWTNTLARPNYYDLVPYRDVIPEDEEVSRVMQTYITESMNLDLMAENYFESVGLVSAGMFTSRSKTLSILNNLPILKRDLSSFNLQTEEPRAQLT